MSNSSWVLRPTPHGQNRFNDFLRNGIVAIGWPFVGDLSNKDAEDLKELLPNNYPYGTVNAFVNKIQPGDLILVPDDNEIAIAEVTGEYQYDMSKDNEEEGYPHQREVKWLAEGLLKKNIPAEIKNLFKSRWALINAAEHQKAIESLINRKRRGRPPKTAVKNTPEEKTRRKSRSDSSLLNIVYPLRPDVFVNLSVPRDMTKHEAQRLAKFCKTVYFNGAEDND